MKLGTETGSLINHLYSRGTSPVPKVGDGATVMHWTDRSAATVIEVREIRGVPYVTIQGDTATRVDKNGMSECQDYEYTANPNGGKSTYRLKNGKWEAVSLSEETNRWKKSYNQNGIRFGVRDAYHDFSF
jgi:hypothetical protein